MNDLEKKKLELEELKKQNFLRENLPHMFGLKLYYWQREFMESPKKICLCTAANQIGKSTIQIMKAVHWATEPSLWATLWPGFMNNQPNAKPVFWYLYPNYKTSTEEVENKWIPYILPRGAFKDHPQYGWSVEKRGKEISCIVFNSGAKIYLKTYNQSPSDLMAGTVFGVFTDEELPVESHGKNLFDELMFRLSATDGYFSCVFTATLGQEFWRLAMECQRTRHETLKEAAKWQISLFDCMQYEDGTQSLWTESRIQERINRCSSENEVQRRIYGKFVKDTGLKVQAFSRTNNVCEPFKIPSDYYIYTGIDYGSGGKTGHPSAIVFLAVSPKFDKGYIFKGWRGDGIETTAGDVINKYVEMRGSIRPVLQAYDAAAKDLHTIASRMGESLVPAEKHHEIGEETINTLFKYNMLFIFDTEELGGLIHELQSIRKGEAKRNAKDDFYDAARYSITRVNWDFTNINPAEIKKVKKEKNVLKTRYDPKLYEDFGIDHDRILDEIEEANELYGDSDF